MYSFIQNQEDTTLMGNNVVQKLNINFQNTKYSLKSFYESKRQAYVADTGYISPMIYTSGNICIKPYDDYDSDIQQMVKDNMKDISIHPDALTTDYIESQWQNADIFYVMTKGTLFCGCVAVDRMNFSPTISHLYVHPPFRGNGYSDLLLAVAEEYTLVLGFNSAQLWCSSNLIEFYKKKGYINHCENTFILSSETFYVMQKQLLL